MTMRRDTRSAKESATPQSPGRRAILTTGAVLGAGGLLVRGGPHSWATPATPLGTPRPGRDIFVDPTRGSDAADGRFPDPDGHGRGPVRSLERAWTSAVSDAGRPGTDPVLVWMRGGTYRRDTTLRIGPYDGTRGIRFTAMPGQTPVISGARPLSGWQTTTMNGRIAWRTTDPVGPAGLRTLYVNGGRRPRPRLPKQVGDVIDHGHEVQDVADFFYLPRPGVGSEASRTFGFKNDDIRADWHNLQDVEVVSLRDWFDERAPIASVSPSERLCTLAFRPYQGRAWPDLFFYVENVREALTEPGEWYWDRATSELFYLPREDETLDTVTISTPAVDRLVSVEGSPDKPVENVTFAGITFAHTTSTLYEHVSQSASQSIGALHLTYASNCHLLDCTIQTVGEYAVEIAAGCSSITVQRCEITDPGAGGIKIASATDSTPNSGHIVSDNHIHHTGKTAHMGAGVLVMDSGENTVAHNEIHDLFYTGISVGWTWGFSANHASDNRVEFNHVHDLGKGVLSDLGAIYTLGVQTGSVIRNNLLHDIRGYTTAPAAGLYPDEGSSHFVLENNVVYAARPGFHLHYGADNIVRNNIVDATGTGREAILVSSPDRGNLGPYSLSASHNILVVEGNPVFLGVATDAPTIASDDNLLWNVAGDLGDVDLAVPQPMKIVRASDEQDVPGSSTTVVLSSVAAGEFAFGALDRPVTLEAGATYYLVTDVESGGPPWYNPTPLVTTSVAAVNGPVYVSGDGHYVFDPGVGSFGPLNFRYRTSDGTEHVWVESETLGATLRSDYSGFLGVAITIGAQPVDVLALGRFRTGSWWEAWQQAGLDKHSVVADPRFVNAARHDYRVRPTSPALDPPVSYRPVNMSGVGPRS